MQPRCWRPRLFVLALVSALACGRVPEPRVEAGPAPTDTREAASSRETPVDGGGPDERTTVPDAALDVPDAPVEIGQPDFGQPEIAQPEAASSPKDGPVLADAPPPDVLVPMDMGWTPAALPGLVLWLDGAVGVTTGSGNRVSRWEDQSGHGHHAHQPFDTSRPVLVSATALERPAIRFGLNDQINIFLRIDDSEQLRWGTDDFGIWLVARSVNTFPDYGTFIHKNMPGPPYTGWLLGSGTTGDGVLAFLMRYPDITTVTTPPPAYNNDKLLLFGARRIDVTGMQIRVNGMVAATGTAPTLDVSNPFRGTFIGAHGEEPVQQLRGAISEIVAVRGRLSNTQVEALEDYLLDKHKLP